MSLTHTPFANLDVALYGRSFDEMRARRDQRERDARNARLAALLRTRERVTFTVSTTFAAFYPYLIAGEHAMSRADVATHRDNVVTMSGERPLTLSERNAVRAMLRKLDCLAA